MNNYKDIINQITGEEGYWNGTVYSGNRVFVNEKKFVLTNEQVKQIEDAKTQDQDFQKEQEEGKKRFKQQLLANVAKRIEIIKKLDIDSSEKVLLYEGAVNEGSLLLDKHKINGDVVEIIKEING